MRKSPERLLHKAVAAFLDAALPDTWRWSTFPSGGGGRVRGAQLKAVGLKAGWPDILILSPEGRWYSIELKAQKGRLSEEQDKFATWAGATLQICRSIDQVESALRWWGIPLRASATRRAA
jgi:hypothetical protein